MHEREVRSGIQEGRKNAAIDRPPPKCTLCGQLGHTFRGCKRPRDDSAGAPAAPSAQPPITRKCKTSVRDTSADGAARLPAARQTASSAPQPPSSAALVQCDMLPPPTESEALRALRAKEEEARCEATRLFRAEDDGAGVFDLTFRRREAYDCARSRRLVEAIDAQIDLESAGV